MNHLFESYSTDARVSIRASKLGNRPTIDDEFFKAEMTKKMSKMTLEKPTPEIQVEEISESLPTNADGPSEKASID